MAFYGHSPENFKTDLSHFSKAASMFGQAAGFIPQIKEQRESLEFEENLNEKSTTTVAAFSSALSKSPTVVNSWMKNVIGLDSTAEGFNEEFTKKYHEAMGGEPTDVIFNNEEIPTLASDMFLKHFDDNVYDESLSVYGGRGDGKLKRVEMNQAYVGRLGNNIQNLLIPIMKDIAAEGDIVSAMTIAEYNKKGAGGAGEIADPAGLQSMIVDTQNTKRFNKDEKITNANPETMTPTQATDYLVQNKYDLNSLTTKSFINTFTEKFNMVNQSKASDAFSNHFSELSSKSWLGVGEVDIDKKNVLLNSGTSYHDALKNYDEKNSVDKDGNPVPDYMSLSDRFAALPEKIQDNLRQNFESAKKDWMYITNAMMNNDFKGAITRANSMTKADVSKSKALETGKGEQRATIKLLYKSAGDQIKGMQTLLIAAENNLTNARKEKKPDEAVIAEYVLEIEKIKTGLGIAKGTYKQFGESLQRFDKLDIETGKTETQQQLFKKIDPNIFKDTLADHKFTDEEIMKNPQKALEVLQPILGAKAGLTDTQMDVVKRDYGVDLMIKYENGETETVTLAGKSVREGLIHKAEMLKEQTQDISVSKGIAAAVQAKEEKKEGLERGQIGGAERHRLSKLNK